jgi:hypothetical protein
VHPTFDVAVPIKDVPQNNSFRYPSYPQYTLINTGTDPIDGLILTLKVTDPMNNVMFVTEKMVDNVTIIGGNMLSTIKFDKLFVPTMVGNYIFEISYTLPGANSPTVIPGFVNIVQGLGAPGTTTTFNIPGDFLTIQSALTALYARGVGGHVVFQLNSKYIKGYNEYIYPPHNLANQRYIDTFSVLDFRGKIMGAGPNATITFRPSNDLMEDQDPIIIDISNPYGYGLAFGSAFATSIDTAAVNKVTEQE